MMCLDLVLCGWRLIDAMHDRRHSPNQFWHKARYCFIAL